MAVLKCKMCGGDLEFSEGVSVCECEYCGTKQTVPNADNEKKITLFGRANRLRARCEFDKAYSIYESIAAEFPEEAEAYWGLVICSFGIEYVDDPATARKIPTCHRASFTAVADDENYQLALEYADVMAQKVYRDEAREIDRIRNEILSVSRTEKPYDIFICYKETADDGGRTIDSVIAQDTYDALTAKGYRVFFSRITLEDKLGTEYEPYIFAALNSAKIMLVFGTDYEYFNAVWVKNEWSRYLKLMAKDKEKHLIPCYKGIDAYDMPKEFARLQAQDMGKVGALQDLLRGIEKILPKQQNTTVIREKVVVGGSGDDKIESLLDRGNMALEDGDWAKADSFFEDVLNNDSKNAQAYIGKALAQERCRTIDAFARKRKNLYQSAKGETLYIEHDEAHINEKIKQYCIEGYIEESDISVLYYYDRSYHSEVSERRQQYKTEEVFWKKHKLLSKAEKFAVGMVAETFTREKQALFAALAERIKQAEATEAAAVKALKESYAQHLKQGDEKAEKLYKERIAMREQDYQSFLQIANDSCDIEELKETADRLAELGEYKESKSLSEHCRKRAAEEQSKLDAENERQRLIKKKALKKKVAIISIVFVASIAVFISLYIVISLFNAYNHAISLLKSEKYDEAISAFSDLGDFKDSKEQITIAKEAKKESMYQNALELLDFGRGEEALEIFEGLNDYKDSKNQCEIAKMEIKYQNAVTLVHGKKADQASARELFIELGDYKDSSAYLGNYVERAVSRKSTGEYKYRDVEYSLTYDPAGFIKSIETVEDKDSYMSYYEWNDSYTKLTVKENSTVTYTIDYDATGKMVKWSRIHKDGSGTRSEFSYTYNADGTVATRTEKCVNVKDSNLGYDSVITYHYNSDGVLIKTVENLVEKNYGDNRDSSDCTTTYTYDESGRLVQADEESVKHDIYSDGKEYQVTYNQVHKYTYEWVYAPEDDGHAFVWILSDMPSDYDRKAYW